MTPVSSIMVRDNIFIHINCYSVFVCQGIATDVVKVNSVMASFKNTEDHSISRVYHGKFLVRCICDFS